VNKTAITVLSLIILALVVVVLMAGMKVEFLDETFRISGVFGTTLRYADILSVDRLETIPAWGSRRFGIGMGFLNIGWYHYREYGSVRVLQTKLGSPYLLVSTATEKMLLGFGTSKNEEIYRALEERIAASEKK
jgi:hypothetical protein